MQNIETILIILVSVVAALVFFQFIILFALFLVLRKSAAAAQEYAGELRTHVVPVLDHSKDMLVTVRALIARIEPKLEAAATDLAEITHTAIDQAKKVQASTDEITDRVRRQVERVDGMATTALNTADRVGHFLNQAVNRPVRQVSGIMAAAKAVIETLRAPSPRRSTSPTPPTTAKPEAETGQVA